MVEKAFTKDPDAVLDYAFDWSDWLASSEAISSHTVTAEAGITKDSDAESGGIVTVWLSAGTAGNTYTVACEIVTDGGRTDERTVEIRVARR